MSSFAALKYYIRLFGVLGTEPPNISVTIFRRVFALTSLTSFMASSIWFFLFEARTAEENSLSVLAVTGTSMCLLKYSIFLRNISKVVQIFDDIDEIIEKRKR